MKTAALPHRWISISNSTSSSSVRLPWKASSFEVPLCCVLLCLANPVVEPQATRGVILSMFSITLFALICLPCAHALTYVWKTFGSPWQDAPSLARGRQNHPSPLDSESLHCHLCGVEAPLYTLRYSMFLLRESNLSSTWHSWPPPPLLASKRRLPFSCICCRVCLQSRETFSLSENVAEFIPHVLPGCLFGWLQEMCQTFTCDLSTLLYIPAGVIGMRNMLQTMEQVLYPLQQQAAMDMFCGS